MARQRPKAVTLTEAAATRVKKLMADRDLGYLRVGVKNGGCAGMEYVMDYVAEPDPLDERVEDQASRSWWTPSPCCSCWAPRSIMRLLRCTPSSSSAIPMRRMPAAAARV